MSLKAITNHNGILSKDLMSPEDIINLMLQFFPKSQKTLIDYEIQKSFHNYELFMGIYNSIVDPQDRCWNYRSNKVQVLN